METYIFDAIFRNFYDISNSKTDIPSTIYQINKGNKTKNGQQKKNGQTKVYSKTSTRMQPPERLTCLSADSAGPAPSPRLTCSANIPGSRTGLALAFCL